MTTADELAVFWRRLSLPSDDEDAAASQQKVERQQLQQLKQMVENSGSTTEESDNSSNVLYYENQLSSAIRPKWLAYFQQHHPAKYQQVHAACAPSASTLQQLFTKLAASPHDDDCDSKSYHRGFCHNFLDTTSSNQLQLFREEWKKLIQTDVLVLPNTTFRSTYLPKAITTLASFRKCVEEWAAVEGGDKKDLAQVLLNVDSEASMKIWYVVRLQEIIFYIIVNFLTACFFL